MKNIQEFHPRVGKSTCARLSQNLVWFSDSNVYVLLFLKIPRQYNIERFHMTSRRPCWCFKQILWELNCLLTQTISFVHINLHRCWPREWKRSIGFSMQRIVYSWFNKGHLGIGSYCLEITQINYCIVPYAQCQITNNQSLFFLKQPFLI